MSRDILISQLYQCRKKAVEDIRTARADNRAEWAHIKEATIQPLVEQLRLHQEIADLEGQVYLLPNESSVIDLKSVAIYLIDRSRRVSPEGIIDSLLRIANERTIEQLEVRLLEGLSIQDEIRINDEFSVVPVQALSGEGHPKELLSRDNVPQHGWGAPPGAAVARKRIIPLQLAPRPVGDEPFPEPNEPSHENLWKAALQTIVLTSDGAPQYRQGYQVQTDAGWLGMASNGWGGSESFPVQVRHATVIQAQLIPETFSHLTGSKSENIDLAIRRLESARRRIDIEDTVIDLGLCSEILLMGGSKDNAEISYKLATRAAWLIDGGPDKRLTTFSLIRNLYNLRSSAAHTGKLKNLKSMEDEEQRQRLIKSADQLCALLVVEVLRKGVPNDDGWKNIILNAPLPQ